MKKRADVLAIMFMFPFMSKLRYGAKTLSVMTFSIMTLSISDIQNKNTKHNFLVSLCCSLYAFLYYIPSVVMLSVIMMSVIMLSVVMLCVVMLRSLCCDHYAECCYAEWRYAECRGTLRDI
jgi:hypothetical protein